MRIPIIAMTALAIFAASSCSAPPTTTTTTTESTIVRPASETVTAVR